MATKLFCYVAQSLGITQSCSCVLRPLGRFLETGSYSRRPGTGRQRCTIARDDRFLTLAILRNRTMTAVEVRNRLAEVRDVHVKDLHMAQSLPGSIESTDLHSHMNMRIGIWNSGAKYCSQISPAFVYELQMVDKEFGKGPGNAHEVGINRMEWPPRSPDLNPIEHVWDMIEKKVKARIPAPATLDEMFPVLQEDLPDDQAIVNVVESMPRRMEAVIQARGGNTRY
ncbi:hypothetical protein GEV33_007501 [Tenebrio molitor]|uniref:Tc1-like transposase DDE domain-containing protein n=1 Tax=Tenebrio molitor TaxID=7067 RepID=A0A8J6HJM2_TENMO|nr:hypothetical protein GEV33_007501 [Tenebrio molitor]